MIPLYSSIAFGSSHWLVVFKDICLVMDFRIFFIITLSTTCLTGFPADELGKGNGTTSCVIPNIPENGNYIINNSNRTPVPNEEVPAKTILEYMCKSKNYTIDGQSIIQCRDGAWHPSVPECKKLCPYIQSSTSTSICQYNGKTINCTHQLKHGTVVNYKCKSRHFSRENLRPRTCVDGIWDFPLPICVAECGAEPENSSVLILGGQQVINNNFPWHVGIYRIYEDGLKFVQICGGTIIRNNIVISAGHCFFNEETNTLFDKFFYRVAGGKLRRVLDNSTDNESPHFQVSEITKIMIPEQYAGNDQLHQADIALLELKEPFNFSRFLLPICVDFVDDFFDSTNQLGKVVVWGGTSDGSSTSDYFKTADISFASYNECRNNVPRSFLKYLTYDKYCARYLNRTNLCLGDGGNGMVFKHHVTNVQRWYLRGVVSVGFSNSLNDDLTCRNVTYLGLTRVFSHRDWIMESLTKYY